MAPVCPPFGPMSHPNWHTNPGAMQEQLRAAGPIARLCGEVAGLQLEYGRHFVQEQPHPSSLCE
eukprot:4966459-Alexandrium_andersonii.AAC.1